MRNPLYFKTYKNLNTKVKSQITYFQMSDILKDLFMEIFNEIITKNMRFKMPVGLGYVKIIQSTMKYTFNEDGTIKRVRSMIDFGACKKLWKQKYGDISQEELKSIKDKPIIFHENEHSNGKIYKIIWTRHPKSRLFFYTLNLSRGGYIDGLYSGTRGLAAYAKTKGFKTEYYQTTNFKKMISGKYTTIERVIEKVQRTYGIEAIDFENAVEWSAELYGMLGLNAMYQKIITNQQGDNPALIPVSNFTALLPSNLVTLESVSRVTQDSEGNIQSFPMQESMMIENDYSNKYIQYATSIPYSTFEYEDYSLTAENEVLNTNVHFIPISDPRRLMYKVRNGVINTSFEEGFLMLTYMAYPTDQDGMLLIPEDEIIVSAFVKNIVRNIDRLNYRINPTQSNRIIMNDSEKDYLHAVGQAHGEVHMPNIDQMESIKNMWLRNISHPNEHANNFATANVQQRQFTQKRIRF